MKKLNLNDFPSMMPPRGSVGGSVAKSMQKQSEAFNGQIPGPENVLSHGGTIPKPAQPINKVDLASPNPVNGQALPGKGIKTEDVIAFLLVTGVIAFAVVATVKIIRGKKK